ncbi:MAG TPA: spore coat U domain-containing protein [Steroidobacteraceae bacterium]|nr:spore coat U domain-containing protein [Steroidobacteraceae bacterium]
MVSLNRCGYSQARLLVGCLGAALLLSAAGNAAGATATTTITVSATLASTCTVSANPLSFGIYQPGQGSMSASTTLAVRCTRGAPFNVALNAGTGGGTVAQRLMSLGASRLQYNLYTTAAHTTVWGDGTQSTATVSGTGHGLMSAAAITHTVYGQLPDSAANVDLAPGLYSDTITVIVSY